MAKNTIILKNYSDIFEEYDAAGAITPGMLVEYTSAGKVQAHSSAGQNAIPMVPIEDALQGKGIDDAYSADDPTRVWIPGRGDQAYMILADGNSVTKGGFLESDGNGYLQAHTPDVDSAESGAEADTKHTYYSNQIVAQALESLDTSSSSALESSGALGYAKRIKVRIV